MVDDSKDNRSRGSSGRGDFGRAWLAEWAFDPDVTYLNHGTVGAPPRRVVSAQQALRDEIETQPARFMLRDLGDFLGANALDGQSSGGKRLRAAAAVVAEYIGAQASDVAFVDNASTGVNAVLRSLALQPDDEILLTDHAYGATAKAAQFAARERGAHVRTIEVPYPRFEPQELVHKVELALSERTRLVLIEHITSDSALLFPVAAIAARCRARGVPVLVDGAHAPGAIELDVPALGVDWYTGNLHKWAYAPRSCGFLWAASARQAGLHPPVVSWGLDGGFAAEFDWVGTRDPSAYLALPAVLAFRREVGEQAILRYNHALAWKAAQILSDAWRTRLGIAEEHVGCMVTVPLPASWGSTSDDALRVRNALLFEHGIEVHLSALRGQLGVRVCAQIYNEETDIAKLAAALRPRGQSWLGSPSA